MGAVKTVRRRDYKRDVWIGMSLCEYERALKETTREYHGFPWRRAKKIFKLDKKDLSRLTIYRMASDRMILSGSLSRRQKKKPVGLLYTARTLGGGYGEITSKTGEFDEIIDARTYGGGDGYVRGLQKED
jgi:hypothetical protein